MRRALDAVFRASGNRTTLGLSLCLSGAAPGNIQEVNLSGRKPKVVLLRESCFFSHWLSVSTQLHRVQWAVLFYLMSVMKLVLLAVGPRMNVISTSDFSVLKRSLTVASLPQNTKQVNTCDRYHEDTDYMLLMTLYTYNVTQSQAHEYHTAYACSSVGTR